MIFIPCDEAKAYDELSILSVKSQVRPEVRPDWDRLMEAIVRQVDPEKHQRIMAEIYPIMWATNSATFHLVDQVPEDDPVDNFNYRRYQLKQQLQKRFFPDTPQTEQKIGYDK
jgi:hypothetical protein